MSIIERISDTHNIKVSYSCAARLLEALFILEHEIINIFKNTQVNFLFFAKKNEHFS